MTKYLTVTVILVILLNTMAGLGACSQAENHVQPRLVWEKEFDRRIVRAGVDADLFANTEGDMTACLKWVLTAPSGLRFLDENCELAPEVFVVHRAGPRISPNSEYFCVQRVPEKWWQTGVAHYTVFDWDGKYTWETDDRMGVLSVQDNGSAVFLDCAIAQEPEQHSPLWGARCFDARGRVIGKYAFEKAHYLWGVRYLSTSGAFFAVAAVSGKADVGVHVFSETGQLVWRREPISDWRSDKFRTLLLGDYLMSPSGGITVSDRGEVLLVLVYTMPNGSGIHVYDAAGGLRDSLLLPSKGSLHSIGTHGRLAFATIGGMANESGDFLCYDFEKMQLRFLIEAENEYDFGNFDVDLDAGLLAIWVEKRDRQNYVRIYDLWGEYKTQVAVDGSVWLRLLDGALLTAEGNRLRLYEISPK